MHAERDVSFDNGPDGSVAEDCFFAMKAFSKGYTFDWIEGEMYEKSPFTLMDFVKQRKRWLQGILLVVHSRAIPFRYKIFLAFSVYSWCTMPLMALNIYFGIFYPVPCPQFVDITYGILGSTNFYMQIFGVIKSITFDRSGKTIFCLIAVICIMPLNLTIECAAVLWGILAKNKHKFHVVEKEVAVTEKCRLV